MKSSSLIRRHSLRLSSICALALSLTQMAHAVIVGQYATDANTLHLWHLNEAAVPCLDSVSPGGTNLTALSGGATLNNASFSGFGTALSTYDLGPGGGGTAANIDAALAPVTLANSAADNTPWSFSDPTTGAFTFETLVYIAFDPSTNLGTVGVGGSGRNTPMQIVSGEQDGAGGGIRSWQFRIDPVGFNPNAGGFTTPLTQPALEFINVNNGSAVQNFVVLIPNTGPDAIASNGWYHVAVTYNGNQGTADNFKMYWTLMDATRNTANQILSAQMNLDLNASGAVDLCLGNTGRTTPNNNFIGMLDEVRISKVARGAGGMMFASGTITFDVNPSNTVATVGQPVTLLSTASGLPTLGYQWRHEGTNIVGATGASYFIPAAAVTDAGIYDVVVTNGISIPGTSAVATLTIRTALNLTWIGSADSNWETSLINWDTDGNGVADAAYTPGDNVTFDSNGSAVPVVNITNIVTPSRIIVNSATDYTLTTLSNSTINNTLTLTKGGAGKLTLDIDGTFSQGTTVQAGTLQIGNASARGSLLGPITNNGSLVVFRTGALTWTNFVVGSGSLTNNATNTITVSGQNLMSGPIALNAGALVLANAQAKGPSTEYVLNAAANSAGPTRLTVGGGVTFGPSTTISLLGTQLAPSDTRCSLTTSDGTNTFSGGIALGGDGNIQFASDGPASNSLFNVTAPAINAPGFTGQLLFRGNGSGFVSSPITVGGKVSKTDGGTWTIASTGNTWYSNDIAGGILKMGAAGVMPAATDVRFAGTGTLDLAGFNQQIGLLVGLAANVIANSSTTADATLTVNPPAGPSIYNGVIRDSVSGGTRKVGLTVAGGALTLAGTNTYTGNTTISAGALNLLGAGNISNSANIFIANGASLDATFRTDTTLVVNPNQTLKGNGAFNVFGNLVNAGTIEMKVNKSGATLSNDSINSASAITFGGTLKVNVTASPALTTSDSFVLFAPTSFTGAFADVIPSPGPGLAWDTSTLATDGTLRIATSTVPTTGTNITFSVSGGQASLSWPANYIGWRLQAQFNSRNLGISTNWVDVPGSSTTNQVFIPINPADGCIFYRMIYQ